MTNFVQPHAPAAHKFDFKIAIAIILGNTFAWGDFALYAYFSPILAHVFFPFTTAANAYILYFIIFAIAFIFRPIGSAIAGVFADRHGRKNTLLFTVIISSILTTLIGCLPSYNTIGFFSPLLLTLLRVLQTMSISAEPTNSGSLLIEHADPRYKGFVTSCVMIGIFLGFLSGIFSFLMISDYMTLTAIKAWGWRIPFISSIFLGAIVAVFLINTEESPLFLQRQQTGKLEKIPLRLTLKNNAYPIFIAFGYSLLMGVANYFLLGFVPDFLANTLHVPLKVSNLYITISLLICVLLTPLMGLLSDWVGRRPVIAAGALGYLIFSYPLMWLLASGNHSYIALALIIYGVIQAPATAVVPAAIAEMLPFAVRCTASTIGYNLALTLFGGTAPIIAQLLIHFTGKITSPFYYIALVSLPHLMFIIFSKETKNYDVRI